MSCDMDPRELGDRLCCLCNQPAGAHAARDEVRIQLPRELWDAVLGAMSWSLPKAADEDSPVSRHAERCFLASRCIRQALGRREIPGRIGHLQRNVERAIADGQKWAAELRR